MSNPKYLLTMAKIQWAPGIQSVSGALAKPKKRNGHSCGDYLIGTHRVAPTENNDCNRIYLKNADTFNRSTALSEDEINARSRFTAVSRAVKARKRDLQYIAQDQIDFMAQKDTAGGKKTMQAYLWKVCGDAYDAQHSNG